MFEALMTLTGRSRPLSLLEIISNKIQGLEGHRVDGLIHISQLALGRRVEVVEDVVLPGDRVFVKVLRVEDGGRRISLSMSAVDQSTGKEVEEWSEPRRRGGGGGDGDRNHRGRGPNLCHCLLVSLYNDLFHSSLLYLYLPCQ